MKRKLTVHHPLLRRIGEIADKEKVRAFVVGGYVRDELRGEPGKDIDIVVLGKGIAFASIVARTLGLKNLVTFPKFGTAMLPMADGKLEFVGARKESYDKKSRKPAVEEGTLEEDLSRRDFTVNAIAASLNSESFAEIMDPFGGQKDLEKKILRTPLNPRETFDDDP